MARAERIGSGLLLAFGLFTIYQASRLPTSSLLVGIGPGFLPLWLGVGLVLVSAFRLVALFRAGGAGASPAPAPSDKEGGTLVQDDSGSVSDALPAPTPRGAVERDVLSGGGSEIVVESAAPERPGGWPRVAVTLAVVAAYALLLEPLGYILATLLLLGSLLILLRQRALVTAAVSVVGAVGSYALFHTWLKVPLPMGILDFLGF